MYNILIRKGYKVFVGTVDGVEIDFVAQKEEKKLYIQVCYLIDSEDTYQREFGNLALIRDSFEKMVVSLDEVTFKDETGIQHIKLNTFEEYFLRE